MHRGPPSNRPSLSFDRDGHVLLAGLYGDDIWDGVEVPKAAIALAVSEDGGRVFRPRELYGEEVEYSPTHFVGSDKPWMIVDHRHASPYEGSVYLVWTRVTVRLDPDPPVITRARPHPSTAAGVSRPASMFIVRPHTRATPSPQDPQHHV